ncbi:MAG TPA: mandelate racemase/muconate lactonizing enzyme family protein [Bryobacteraceae bacterium]|nr:mandelate racemase/muconate lactonizing enzyme family protein [Bryobacteraceae bacterium]
MQPHRCTRRELFARASAALAACAGVRVLPALDRAPRLRITNVESFQVRVPATARDPLRRYDYAVTRVHTDGGIVGTSFLGCPRDVLEHWVKPTLVGDDVFAIDRHLKRLQMERGESGVQSWSGVEHAMWDAVGKAVGRPVAQILGGARDRLRVYRTCVFPGKPEQSDVPYETQAKFAVRLKQSGYSGIKVRAWRPRPMDDVDMVGVMRRAVGEDFHIMLDRTAVRPGWVWDYPTALQVCRGLESHRAYWLEEPFDGYDLLGPARLAAEVSILITGGELGNSVYHFLNFLLNKTYDVLQPDTRICGGIWMAKKISVLADSFGVPCIQHGNNSLSIAGYIQAGCAMPNCQWQEIIGGPNLPEEEWEPALKLVRTPHVFPIQDGYVLLPDLPGLGLDVNEDAIREYRVNHA